MKEIRERLAAAKAAKARESGTKEPLAEPNHKSPALKTRTPQDTVVESPPVSLIKESRRTKETEVASKDSDAAPSPAAVPDAPEISSPNNTQQIDLEDEAVEFIDLEEEKANLFARWKSQGLTAEEMADQLWHIMYDTNVRMDVMEEAMTAAFGEGSSAKKAEKRVTQMIQKDTDKHTIPTIEGVYKWVQDMMQTKIRLQAMQKAWSRFEQEHINPVISENNDLRQRVAELERQVQDLATKKKGWFGK